MTDATKFKQLSLKDAAQFDAQNGARGKLTGWGAVCKARAGRFSKSQIRKKKRDQSNVVYR